MNKKFSTLMAGFLLTSVFASAAITDADVVDLLGRKIQVASEVKSGTSYFIVQDNDNDGKFDDGDQILGAEISGHSSLYLAPALSNSTDINSASIEKFIWKVTEKEDGTLSKKYYYSFFNQAANNGEGLYLTYKLDAGGDAPITNPKDSKGAYDAEKQLSGYFYNGDGTGTKKFAQGCELWLYGATASSYVTFGNNAELTVGTAKRFLLCELAEEQTADIAKMNDTMGGNGFNLTFEDAEEYGDSNIFKDLNLKAFEVGAGVIDNVPAGTYLALADELPTSLKAKDAELDTKEEFEAATFVAVDPAGNLNINKLPRTDGRGFFFKTVKGFDFFFFNSDADGKSKKDEIYVGNACFEIINPNLGDETTYQIYVKKLRGLKEVGKDDHIEKDGLFIGSVSDQNVNYVVTNSESEITFTLTNGTLYDPTKLLNATDAPAVYTIQFLSKGEENDEEYGQYLTTSASGSTKYDVSVVDINENDPLYQYMITAVDEDEKTVTFTNRQTKKDITLSLYAVDAENLIFTVYSSGKFHYESVDGTTTNEVVAWKAKDLDKTKIQLTKVDEINRFETFLTHTPGDGFVTFELAKNLETSDRFNVAAQYRDGEPANASTLKASKENVDQFELVNADTKGKPKFETKGYIYLKNDRVVTSTEKDTVAYYIYNVKVADTKAYVGSNLAISATPQTFVVKENVDGSISLIPYSANVLAVANAQYAKAVVTGEKENEDAWQLDENYDLSAKYNAEFKTFLVKESGSVSYEVAPQHVSFGLERGGFLTSKDNDAFKSIAAEASEELTFWLDTVKSDNVIPSFYIAKAGSFLYNAADSAEVWAKKGNYRFNLENQKGEAPKLIFKTGELVSSDTLRTVVDGKSVLVAEKDNAPKKIKGGLNNFQFQLVLADDASDEYVIRQGAQYVQEINSYFYLSGNKKTAVRFVIEQQSTPTANEGIATSEVKVIAGEGNVTIAGAQGKKVIVSNILGQAIANTVLSSDNATIAAPAGVVVVAVEGETAVKAIVK